jgi:hypothetical protein
LILGVLNQGVAGWIKGMAGRVWDPWFPQGM